MVSVSQLPAATLSRIKRLQTLTLVWMTLEAALSLFAAWRAKSPALLAFGGDSAVELLSALVVLWRFSLGLHIHDVERRAARLAGALLFALAALVTATSILTLLGHAEPRPTYLGIAILIAATILMPWLARQKRKLSAETASAALRADAAQSSLCAWLSFIALLGLASNALWSVPWADPLAALALTPLILWEGKESFAGKPCQCS